MSGVANWWQFLRLNLSLFYQLKKRPCICEFIQRRFKEWRERGKSPAFEWANIGVSIYPRLTFGCVHKKINAASRFA